MRQPNTWRGNELTERQLGPKKNFSDVTELVRSIQRAEGYDDCFRKAQGLCDHSDCTWRAHCVESHKTPGGKKI